MIHRSERKVSGLALDVFEPEGASKGTIMFCHGAWVGGWIWEGFASHFASQGYLCQVPTWRGRYDSKVVDDIGSLSVIDFVEDALMIARSTQPDIIVGESMGGLIAQKVAEGYPGLKGLVLMNSVPPFMAPASWEVTRKQFRYLGDLLSSKPNLPREDDYKALILNNVEEPEASEFYRRICPESGRALREMSLGRIKVDASKVNCPVYVVVGHLDKIFPPKVHHKLARLYGATIAEYPEMSHHTFSESGWENVAHDLAIWLEDKIPHPVA